MNEQFSDKVIVGWTDPSMSVQNIPILRNATQFISHHAMLLDWQFQPIPVQKKISRFVVLRDPYERWLTGFTEDLKLFIRTRDRQGEKEHLYNMFNKENFDWFLDFVIDRDVLFFDSHAKLQYKYIESELEILGKDEITFMKLTDTFGYFLNHWLHSEGCKNNFNNGKINARHKENDEIYKKIVAYMMDGKNLKRKEKVLDYLQPDYQLFNSVNFINPT